MASLAGPVRRHEGQRGQTAKELEAENARLKKLAANQALDIDMLEKISTSSSGWPECVGLRTVVSTMGPGSWRTRSVTGADSTVLNQF